MHRRLGAAFAVLAAVAPVVPASAAEEVDRGLIVFSRDCEMYGVDPVTSVERKLTSTDTCGPHGVAHRHPSWTPDGAQLVYSEHFEVVDDETDASSDVVESWSLDLSTMTSRRLSAAEAQALVGDPSISSDGSLEAFVTDRGAIAVRRVDGGRFSDGSSYRVVVENSNPVPDSGGWTLLAVGGWSPVDPDLLAVYSNSGSAGYRTKRLDFYRVSSGELVASTGSGHFDWHPAGGRVVVLPESGTVGSVSTSAVVFEIDTGRSEAVFTAASSELLSATWSPSGGQIAVLCGPLPVPDPPAGSCPSHEMLIIQTHESGPAAHLPLGSSYGTEPSWGVIFGSEMSWQPWFGQPFGLVDPATGIWRLRTPEGGVRSFYFGDPGDVPFLGDWDCDGVDTPGLYRSSDGFVYLRNANRGGVADVSFYFGDPGDVPLAGDWNGDGCDTVSLYRPGEQRFFIINELGSAATGLGAAEFSFGFGNPGDVPVAGDWDGDQVDGVGLHRPSTGLFYFRNVLATGVAEGEFVFGDPGDRLMAGDWDGSGVDTPGVFRPATTKVYLHDRLGPGVAGVEVPWGDVDWVPVSGSTTFVDG